MGPILHARNQTVVETVGKSWWLSARESEVDRICRKVLKRAARQTGPFYLDDLADHAHEIDHVSINGKENVNVKLFGCSKCLNKLCPRPSIASMSLVMKTTVPEEEESAPPKLPLTRCRQLKHRATGQRWEHILFTDFCPPSSRRTTTKMTVTGPLRLPTRRPSSNTAKIRSRLWVGICASGKTPPPSFSWIRGSKQEVYRRYILEAVVLSWPQRHFDDVDWTLQQDFAPVHKAKLTQDWCRAHFPNFITPVEWPPYSTDLNPIDYSVLSILQASTCATRLKSLKLLKRSLHREWDRLSPWDLRPIAEKSTSRLDLCIVAMGDHFETG
ncbi:hypothetical protein LAZ67_13001158 [Cordylochernes scorpioides]|uniref:Tc1-like transposase DDE domain-containing protein n=1 Tax=Cordylochernes scorpioides TaxID=51811 RepID=A0ABY6L4D9_9ARAC|nr:hypothetical protein LAZ67_13001158 [Cordylochernes scorpioides]